MIILKDSTAVSEQCLAWQKAGQSVALVPTMGFFHQGHASLMQAARQKADKVVVSLFVNPAQFAPGEDLGAYPRDVEKDRLIAEGNCVNLLFMPEVSSLYPEGYDTWASVPGLSKRLCGKTRPMHFQGVCTVVLKLFNICRPDFAFFGQKDWQQLAVIRRMTQDLNLNVQIQGEPIVRETDGLAMSSRNSYLSPDERAAAPHIHKGLAAARELFGAGETNIAVYERSILDYWAQNLPQARVDYLEFVDPSSLASKEKADAETLIATAVYLGKARLLDNQLLGA